MKFINLVVIFSIILTSDQFIKGLQGKSVSIKRKNRSPLKQHSVGTSGKANGKVVRSIRQTENMATEPDKTSMIKDQTLSKSLRSTQIIKASADDKIVEIDDKASYVDVLMKCSPIIKLCLLTSVDSNMCALSCLFDPFKILKNTVRLFGGVIESLCSPIGSVFDSVFSTLFEREDIKRVSSFLKILGVTDQDFIEYGQAGANALPMQLIKYATSPILDVLKPVISSISGVINGAQSGFHSITYFSNPICKDVDFSESVQKLADTLISFPFAADVALGGWFVLINVAELRTGVIQDEFQSILMAFRLFAGVKCSLLEYAQTGEYTPCVSVVGDDSAYRKPSNKLNVDEEVCGSLPDLPPVDLHKLLPDVFPQRYDSSNDTENEIQL